MKKLWSKEEDEILEKFYPTSTNKELSKILNRTAEAVRSRARALGLKKVKQKSWSEEEISYLMDNYSLKKIEDLMAYFNRSKASIFCKADDLGLTLRNSSRTNMDFFKEIDSEAKAYWLGFIYADGYISKNKTGAELGIELSSIDIHHLHKFNEIFNNYYKVNTFNKKPSKYNIRATEQCSIRVYSKEIVENLIEQGIVENKTHSTTHPILNDDEMFLHFLRGYIDGDGSYSIKKTVSSSGEVKLYPRITIVGNCKEAFEYIVSKLKDFNVKATIYQDGTSYKLQIGKTKDCVHLIELMYSEATIFLERKHNKVQELIKLAVLDGNI